MCMYWYRLQRIEEQIRWRIGYGKGHVNMTTSKYRSYKVRTNQWHREEEAQNTDNYTTAIIQLKWATISLYIIKMVAYPLPHRDAL